MRSIWLLVLLAGATLPLPIRADEPTPIKLHAPPGWTVEVVAAPPLVEHPLMAGFDDRGRLYVADNAGLNLPFEALERERPNAIRRLVDSDGDGVFDRSTVFADRMTFPQGVLWHAGSIYTASPPFIWRLTDRDDDGVADRREELVGTFGSNGNAADIHGCFLGPEGRIWWCDGRHGHTFRDAAGQITSKGLAARLFSARPDGSDVQVHCGGGMDNPVEIDFTPTGDVLGPANLFYPIRGDCLVHWVRGGVYPRADDPSWVGEFRRTGELLPDVFDLGHVAVSGATRVRSFLPGAPSGLAWLVCEFNTHRVCRLMLEPGGSTYRATREEFVWSDDPDVHPTDVLEDADGSFLVIDTGGWFRIGCPTSQIAKPQIAGAIYRVRQTAASPIQDARGLELDWTTASIGVLADRLRDPRQAVRERAIGALSDQRDAALAAAGTVLQSDRSDQRLAAVWTLCRIGSEGAAKMLIRALGDGEADVRQAACAALGTLRCGDASGDVCRLLADPEPAVRRAAATAVGQIGIPGAAEPILAALAEPADRMLEHALTYALIEIDSPAETAVGLAAESSRVRRAALVALDQMPSGKLHSADVVALLQTDDRALSAAAVEIISRRPGWTGEVVEFLRHELGEAPADPARQAATAKLVEAFAADGDVQALVAAFLAKDRMPSASRVALLKAVAGSSVRPLPAVWVEAIDGCMHSPDAQERSAALAAAVTVTDERLASSLAKIADDSAQSGTDRIAAARTLGRTGRPLSANFFDLLVAQLAAEVAPLDRLSAAEALAAGRLSDEQLLLLLPPIAEAGPMELSALVRAFEPGGTAEVGRSLAEALTLSPGRGSLTAGQLRNLFAKYPAEVGEAAAALAAPTADDATRAARSESLALQAQSASAARGKQLFYGPKAACAACHRIGADGGQIGPDLTRVGRIRTHRDLAEAILYPSQSLARGFETYQVQTTGGLSYTGLIARQTADAVWLRSADRTERQLAREDIAEISPASTSIMPDGLDRLLTEAELASIVAFLSETR